MGFHVDASFLHKIDGADGVKQQCQHYRYFPKGVSFKKNCYPTHWALYGQNSHFSVLRSVWAQKFYANTFALSSFMAENLEIPNCSLCHSINRTHYYLYMFQLFFKKLCLSFQCLLYELYVPCKCGRGSAGYKKNGGFLHFGDNRPSRSFFLSIFIILTEVVFLFDLYSFWAKLRGLILTCNQ